MVPAYPGLYVCLSVNSVFRDDPSVTVLRSFFSPTDHWIFLSIQTNRHPIFTRACKRRPLLIFYYFVILRITLLPNFMPFYPVQLSAYLWTLSSWDDPSVAELRFSFSLTDHCIFLTIQKCYSNRTLVMPYLS